MRAVAIARVTPAAMPSFESVYDATFAFVWRSLRRLGVPAEGLDDAAQDVFVVVHRRLPEFEARSTVESWVFGIARHVAQEHRRRARRKGGAEELPAELPATGAGPHEAAVRAEAVRALHEILDAMDDDKREVFILAELEQLPAPAIAEALETNVNTVYSRLRAAREQFNRAVARRRAREREGGR